MSVGNRDPKMAEIFREIDDRFEELERRRIILPTTTPIEGLPLTTVFPGPVSAGIYSPDWYADRAYTFPIQRLSAHTTGSGPLVVELQVNGIAVVTLTLPAATATILVASTPIPLSPGDRYTSLINSVSGTWANASWQLMQQ